MSDIEEQLTDILRKGVEREIFAAETASHLYEVIGNHAEDLRQKESTGLFGFLQGVLVSHLILSISKIYEKKSNRHPARSIPQALDLLEQNCENVKIHYRDALEQKLAALGFDRESLRGLCEPQLTQMVVHYLRQRCPSTNDLKALKDHRDKRLAHNEAIDDAKLKDILWDEIDKFLEDARHVMGFLGNHYLGLIYESNGKYDLSYDAHRLSASLAWFFKEAGIVSNNPEPHE